MKIIITFLMFLFISCQSQASIQVKALTGQPVMVCQSNDPNSKCTISSGGVSGYWSNGGSGNDIFNTNSGNLKIINNTSSHVDTSTGGSLTFNGNNHVRTFTSSGTFTPAFSGTINVLVVAGGGGGSTDGGGGGGGVINNTSYTVTNGTPITVTIGGGGTYGISGGGNGVNGSNSVFGTLTATGGGGGAQFNANGSNGGSGGGAGGGASLSTAGTGVSGQGNSGGINGTASPQLTGGGGGGCGTVGSNGSSSVGGNGGDGCSFSISGSSTYYGGGGGGGYYESATSGNGGLGGGGNGSSGGGGFPGTTNTGGGGGGGLLGGNGGGGGSGIVIVSYLPPAIETARFNTMGNLGIGSTNPGQILDVYGTIRTKNFIMSGQSPTSGYVLTASDSSGDTTWSSAGGVSGWTTSGNDVYETNAGNVGIGTLSPQVALQVGTSLSGYIYTPYNASIYGVSTGSGNEVNTGFSAYYNPGSSVSVAEAGLGVTDYLYGASSANSSHNPAIITETVNGSGGAMAKAIGMEILSCSNTSTGSITNCFGFDVDDQTGGTNNYGFYSGITAGTNKYSFYDNGGANSYFKGNVGIGSLAPGQALDVQGTIRTESFIMSGQSPTSGYVLTASDSSGDTTWSSAGGVSGWTTSGNDVYETNAGNVGIGTTLTSNFALTVLNGNVGIGTWTDNSQSLIIKGNIMFDRTGGFITANGVTPIGIRPNGSGSQVGQIITNTSGVITFGDSAGNAQVIFNNKNIGIGTALPVGSLDVESTVNNAIFFGNGISNKNVGIGSLTPGQLLDVQGTIRTNGFIDVGIGTSSPTRVCISTSGLTICP